VTSKQVSRSGAATDDVKSKRWRSFIVRLLAFTVALRLGAGFIRVEHLIFLQCIAFTQLGGMGWYIPKGVYCLPIDHPRLNQSSKQYLFLQLSHKVGISEALLLELPYKPESWR